MPSGIFKLNLHDIGKAVALLVAVTALQTILAAIQQGGFEVLANHAFWNGVLDIDIKAVAAYLLKNLLTDNQDHVLGIGSN